MDEKRTRYWSSTVLIIHGTDHARYSSYTVLAIFHVSLKIISWPCRNLSSKCPQTLNDLKKSVYFFEIMTLFYVGFLCDENNYFCLSFMIDWLIFDFFCVLFSEQTSSFLKDNFLASESAATAASPPTTTTTVDTTSPVDADDDDIEAPESSPASSNPSSDQQSAQLGSVEYQPDPPVFDRRILLKLKHDGLLVRIQSRNSIKNPSEPIKNPSKPIETHQNHQKLNQEPIKTHQNLSRTHQNPSNPIETHRNPSRTHQEPIKKIPYIFLCIFNDHFAHVYFFFVETKFLSRFHPALATQPTPKFLSLYWQSFRRRWIDDDRTRGRRNRFPQCVINTRCTIRFSHVRLWQPWIVLENADVFIRTEFVGDCTDFFSELWSVIFDSFFFLALFRSEVYNVRSVSGISLCFPPPPPPFPNPAWNVVVA